MSLSQRIANSQTNASAPNAQSQANICQGSGIQKANVPPDYAALKETHPRRTII
jgi:hypothetical protein